MLEKFILRRPDEEHARSVLDLMIRCDIRDVGQPDSDMSDLKYDWSQMDLKQDAWLAMDSNGNLRGYGAVLPWPRGRRLVIYDDAGTENHDLFLGLLILCEKRAASQLLQRADPQQRTIVTHISDPITYQKEVLQKAGYNLHHFIFNMQIDLDHELPQPALPPGIVLRTARTGIDDQHIHAVIQKAFLKPGRPPQAFDEWKEFMMRADLYQADLWFLAFYQDEIVGTCLCFPYENMGWVRQLAVAEGFRKRGLGSALLRHAFREFQMRSFPKVGLAVESSKENAYRIYEKAGMKKVIHLDEYQKKVVMTEKQ